MTAVSDEPPANPCARQAATTPPTKRGIDYSKFDNIEDSDDEKPQATSKKVEAPPEKPHCHNCHKDIDKPLRCGVCKKVAYCSAKCQKDDWPYHKRACQKPAPPKPKEDTNNADKEKKQASATAKKEKAKEAEKIVEDDENLTWYRHREWKPTNEPKQEFKPTQISNAAATEIAQNAAPTAGSAWNKAGTWEDHDVTELAKKQLTEILEGIADVDAGGGVIAVKPVTNLEGEASRPVIRGKQRHMFDFSFKVHFVFKWMDSEGQRQAEGSIHITDFTNDTFVENGTKPGISFSFKDSKLLDASRRTAVEGMIGARDWPPARETFMGHVVARMQMWSRDFQQLS